MIKTVSLIDMGDRFFYDLDVADFLFSIFKFFFYLT